MTQQAVLRDTAQDVNSHPTIWQEGRTEPRDRAWCDATQTGGGRDAMRVLGAETAKRSTAAEQSLYNLETIIKIIESQTGLC